MKLLYIYNISWFFCSHRLLLATKLIELGHEIHLICKIANDEDRIKIESAGIKIYDVNIKRGFSNFLTDIFHLFKIRKIINGIDPDVSEIATIKPILILGFLFKLNKRKVVYWLPGLGFIFTSKNHFIKIVKKLTLVFYKLIFNNFNSKVILENSDDQIFLINENVISKSNSFVLPGSCVELKNYDVKQEPSDLKVVMASRLLWNKGVGDYIEAIKILKKKNIKCKFLLAGSTDNNPSSVPIKTIKKWENDKIIQYLGYVTDIVSLYEDSNVICLPSYREGLPKALVEAGACSRASVTTNVTGCRNIIINNFNGILVPVNDPLKLSLAIESLLLNHNKRKLFAKNAREFVKNNFSYNIFFKKIKSIYFD